ncbi:MAG TPA: TetR/AcrR family transcriptional regulator [Clostridia bacterium]|nr:TetR/AcrR family transcriptional regulator [Clostridia bacterium]
MNNEMHNEETGITRSNLKQAFWKVYFEKRIERISIREIVHVAGYNRGTFYNYFHDIYDILSEIESDLLDETDHCFSLILDNNEMRDQTEASFKKFFENKEYFEKLLGPNGDPMFANALKNRIKSTLRRFIQKTPVSDQSTEYRLEFYSAGIISIINMWLQSDNNFPLKSFSNVIIDSISL